MFQEFKVNDLEQFPKRLQNLLDKQRTKITAITESNHTSYHHILKPMQDIDEELEIFFTPLSHLNSVMNSEQTQKAYEASLPLLSKFGSEIAQNVALFEKIKLIEAEDQDTIDNEEKMIVEHNVRDFVLSGINLSKAKKERMEAISLKLSELSNTFSQNLLDATNAFELVINNEKDVKGIPKSDLDRAKEKTNGETLYRFTLQAPSYLSYMTYGPNRELRRELSKAYSTRAPENEEIIDQILALRQEKSQLLGFENYALYALETKDADSQEDVLDFLNDLADAALPQAKVELEELRDYAKIDDEIDDVESHDVTYYSEKLKKEKFDYNDSMTKPYFEQSKVLDGMLDIVSKLFSVEFKPVKVPTWHTCVKVYDIYENSALSGRLYCDLEARKEKRGGAWMHDWETHFTDSHGTQHLPSAFIACNFAPATKTAPSLLRHDDVVTLFHEMGHAIHHLFSKCNERSVSGINGVAWDTVEFPSQFLENFAYEAAILKRFGFHHETGEPIPQRLLTKIKATKNFQAALGILRQVEFSLFDFMLHQQLYQGNEVQELLDNIRERTALLLPAHYNKFQHGFAHIFSGGYSAGYYSYKWAEVLSADAFFTCLNSSGEFDKQQAEGYKSTILTHGGSQKMSELYRVWLKRKPNAENLLKLYNIDKR